MPRLFNSAAMARRLRAPCRSIAAAIASAASAIASAVAATMTATMTATMAVASAPTMAAGIKSVGSRIYLWAARARIAINSIKPDALPSARSSKHHTHRNKNSSRQQRQQGHCGLGDEFSHNSTLSSIVDPWRASIARRSTASAPG
jgi:hypothetical protein